MIRSLCGMACTDVSSMWEIQFWITLSSISDSNTCGHDSLQKISLPNTRVSRSMSFIHFILGSIYIWQCEKMMFCFTRTRLPILARTESAFHSLCKLSPTVFYINRVCNEFHISSGSNAHEAACDFSNFELKSYFC